MLKQIIKVVTVIQNKIKSYSYTIKIIDICFILIVENKRILFILYL